MRDQLVATLNPYFGNATNEIISAYEGAMRGASPSSLLHRITRDRYWHLPHLPTWHSYRAEDPTIMVFGLETYGVVPLKTLSTWKNER